jgi:hypothetical protein
LPHRGGGLHLRLVEQDLGYADERRVIIYHAATGGSADATLGLFLFHLLAPKQVWESPATVPILAATAKSASVLNDSCS